MKQGRGAIYRALFNTYIDITAVTRFALNKSAIVFISENIVINFLIFYFPTFRSGLPGNTQASEPVP